MVTYIFWFRTEARRSVQERIPSGISAIEIIFLSRAHLHLRGEPLKRDALFPSTGILVRARPKIPHLAHRLPLGYSGSFAPVTLRTMTMPSVTNCLTDERISASAAKDNFAHHDDEDI